MARTTALTCTAVFILTVIILGCEQPAPQLEPYQPVHEKDYSKPLPPGTLALRKIPPSDYPDFRPGFHNRTGLSQAIRHSLHYLAKPSSERFYPYRDITHARVIASLERFLQLLDQTASADELDAAIRRQFDVYQSVGCDDAGTVFFTGYYCPIFDGRLQRTPEFRYPLYGLPPDLVKDEDGRILGQRLPSGQIDPTYPTRRQIEEGRLLDGLEVAWLRSPFETYVVTVQGSARLRLADGTIYELGYAGNNGHEYTPIWQRMVDEGLIRRDEVSLGTLRTYFAQHPDQVYQYAWENSRYVFFQPEEGGPYGSLNTPVTPYRTIATDKSVFPRAALAYAVTTLPRVGTYRTVQEPFHSFALDQDTGGAIRAAGRCDVYIGIGRRAEAVAGSTAAEGRLYYLFLKTDS